MGSKEIELLKAAGIDPVELITLLNKAFADEWLAYYQYWIGAKVAEGIPRDIVSRELQEHATEELNHANLLADRIIQIGGKPILEPSQWYTMANCKYAKPENPDLRVLLDQNIRGEQCAMAVYQKLINFTLDRDPVTYKILVQIYEEEVEHEEDLEMIKRDIFVSSKW